MSDKEATARIKINKLLEAAGWRFFQEGDAPANIRLEPGVTIKSTDLDALGANFEKSSKGFVDFLLLDAKGFPLLVLEAKAEDKNPLIGKEQARKYAKSQNCRFVILSNGNLHYFWDLERGSPYVITSFPTPDSVTGYQKVKPNPQRLIEEQVGADYIVRTQRPNYATEAAWQNEAERAGYIQSNKLRFLRPYQLKAIHSLQAAVGDGKDRFLFEMATGTGKTLTAAAVIKLFLRSGTLTSEERWNEFADVILANPPFMSPKGGIKPHKRFSIQAKRSEVLFVDYMAEHLTPGGRAAIIVPEGIIFQSQTAYKELRRMLVDNSLVAVVSLPAGCFNPYSGVKTSILILDKTLAKTAETIAFFKVENDGFGLGAQRRAFDKNDLPQVQAELAAYLQALRAKASTESILALTSTAQIVPKEKIAANGDYNLSGERYREGDARTSNYATVPIGDICELFNGRAFKPEDWENADSGGIPIVRIQNLNNPGSSFNYYTGEVSEKNTINNGELLFSWSGSRGTSFGAHIWKGQKAVLNQHIFKVGFDESRATKMYLLHALNKAVVEVEENLHGGVGLVHITKGNLEKIEIPLPPLEVQKEIVAEIEGYQKVINGARAVLDHYRPHIPTHPDWPLVELGEVCAIKSGGTPDRSNETFWNGDIPWVTTTLIDYGVIERANEFITPEGLKNSATWLVPKGTVLMAMYGQGVTRGRVAILGIDAAVNQACAVFQLKGNTVDNGYLFRVLQSRYEDLRKVSDARGGNQSNLSAQVLKEYSIPLPPLATQQTIVAEIEAEQALVAANRELITRFEQKIQATLARIWGSTSDS